MPPADGSSMGHINGAATSNGSVAILATSGGRTATMAMLAMLTSDAADFQHGLPNSAL